MDLLTLRCAVEELAGWYPRLYLEPHIVACVSLMRRYSASPGLFEVDCLDIASRRVGRAGRLKLAISWADETESKAGRLRSSMQAKPMVELAATAIGLILARRVVRLVRLDVTAYGERADFRSLSAQTVLEISGTENRSSLVRRWREKVAQALANPFGWDAVVAVCAFSPEGHRARLSFHRGVAPKEWLKPK